MSIAAQERIEQEVARPAAAPRQAAGQAPKRRGALPSSAESASSKGE